MSRCFMLYSWGAGRVWRAEGSGRPILQAQKEGCTKAEQMLTKVYTSITWAAGLGVVLSLSLPAFPHSGARAQHCQANALANCIAMRAFGRGLTQDLGIPRSGAIQPLRPCRFNPFSDCFHTAFAPLSYPGPFNQAHAIFQPISLAERTSRGSSMLPGLPQPPPPLDA